MKMSKRITAIFLSALMLSSVLVLPSFATTTVTMTQLGETAEVTEDGAVKHSAYEVYGSQSEHTEEVDILEFNPEDGYLPMAFAAYAGWASSLDKHYNTSRDKYGFETVGLINGSFFVTATGRLNGLLITNGKISAAHSGYTGEVVAFDSNGKMNVVSSTLTYNIQFNGTDLPGNNDFRYLNKSHASTLNQYDTTFFYYDTSCGNVSDSASEGYEVLCQKMNDTDLVVGGTLVGKVLEVSEETYATKFAEDGEFSDKFVIYLKKTSAYTKYVKDLVEGDTITISVEETNSAAKEIMENAVSVITNVGWLVKDGVDQTLINDTIGTHSVTDTFARWTAFGTKEDGTYVYFTSEGGSTGTVDRSLTLRDVAAAMIELGCTNVIRLDGGGSTSMYTQNGGYVCAQGRNVSDCLMIVKKSSLVNEDLTEALESAVNVAVESVYANGDADTVALVKKAIELLDSDTVVGADTIKYIMELELVKDAALESAMYKAEAINGDNYTEEQIAEINTAYNHCKSLYGATYFDIVEVDEAITALNDALFAGGSVDVPGSMYEIAIDEVTDINSPNMNGDDQLLYYPNNTNNDRVVTGNEYNFRYVYILVCDADGFVVEVGKNLLTTEEDERYPYDFQNEFTIPAGGFAISFFYNTSKPEYNKEAMDFYNAILENCEYTDPTPDTDVLNETVEIKKNRVYSIDYANGIVVFRNHLAYNGLLGDVNGDDSIDTRDYVLVARSYMGTYTLTADEEIRADINGDNVIDTRDYVLIARHYMGTYDIGE